MREIVFESCSNFSPESPSWTNFFSHERSLRKKSISLLSFPRLFLYRFCKNNSVPSPKGKNHRLLLQADRQSLDAFLMNPSTLQNRTKPPSDLPVIFHSSVPLFECLINIHSSASMYACSRACATPHLCLSEERTKERPGRGEAFSRGDVN